MKIWVATRALGEQSQIVIDPHHANVLKINGWIVEESDLPDDSKAGWHATAIYSFLILSGIIGCSWWLIKWSGML